MVYFCVCHSVVHTKDEVSRVYTQAQSLNQAGCKKMLHYLAALFVFVDTLDTMAHGKLSDQMLHWLRDRHLENGLAHYEVADVDLMGTNILWALNIGPAPTSRGKGSPTSQDAKDPQQPFKVQL